MFLCALNANDISSEVRITMLWGFLILYSLLDGIHEKSLNNSQTPCLGGIFLAIKKVEKLRTTTTESLEHVFRTAPRKRREFTVNEFIRYVSKLDNVTKNAIQNDMKTATSSKGDMTGFAGFASVIINKQTKSTQKRKNKCRLSSFLS